MTEIISVRFHAGGKQYYFDPRGLTVKAGQKVLVETGKGQELAVCVRGNRQIEDAQVVQPLRAVVRLATERDLRQEENNKKREVEAMRLGQQEIERHGLDMKLVRVEMAFDGSKIIFFFTADGRVDFRSLVRDLAGIFHTRIELRQIGVRDEARMLGGLGICGKPFCCAQFLDEFQPVSIKMAKTQSLSLNPSKISGTCGRLMCCLKYEEDAYEDAARRCPRMDSFVECPDGVGCVCQVDLLREQVKVHLEGSDEQPRSYHNDEIRVVRSGKGRRPEGYVTPPKAELEKLRRPPEPGQTRPGWRTGDGEDLSTALDRFLGDAGREEKGARRSRSRSGKDRQGGQPKAQPQQAPAASEGGGRPRRRSFRHKPK